MSKKLSISISVIVVLIIIAVGVIIGAKSQKTSNEGENQILSSSLTKQSITDFSEKDSETEPETTTDTITKNSTETTEKAITNNTTETTEKTTAKKGVLKNAKTKNGFDYSDTIRQYYYERKNRAADLGYDITVSNYYYCVKDINSDGIEELIISEHQDNDMLSGLYTVHNGKAENIFFIERHGHFYITADGYVERQYKGLSLHTLEGTELNRFYETTVEDREIGWEIVAKEYKLKNGISTKYMNFDFNEYHFSE